MKIRKAIIPVAGWGTRFLAATVELALRRADLRQDFLQYLRNVVEREGKQG